MNFQHRCVVKLISKKASDVTFLTTRCQLLVHTGKLLDVNNDAAWIVDALSLSDSHPELRCLRPSTAPAEPPSAGKKEPFMGRHVVGDGYVAAGNVLVGQRVVAYIAKTYASAARSSKIPEYSIHAE
ncbi:hypothetical protein GALL_468930 [mine drainage metagenome]|uniref:Uncharacterized protein n=1 Tax=mine drainage metagenome TaxID=410659 RepID=A0A1J5Q1Y6_9ZZZZ